MVVRARNSNHTGGCQAIPRRNEANRKRAFGPTVVIVIPQEKRKTFDKWKTCL